MAAELRGGNSTNVSLGVKKLRSQQRGFTRKRLRFFLSPRFLRYFGLFCLIGLVFTVTRQFGYVANISHHVDLLSRRAAAQIPVRLREPDAGNDDDDDDGDDAPPIVVSEASVNLWRHIDHNCPPEVDPPDPKLYGTGTENCFSIGLPEASAGIPRKGEPASFWQMNSRALCYSAKPLCLYGRSLQNMLTFEKRGMGKCHVVAVEKGALLPAREHGLNESCAAWRKRQVVSMYGGKEVFSDYRQWEQWTKRRKYNDQRHHPIKWESDFAIVVPKYDWSYNICHYNRIWNFIVYTIRNLYLFVPDADRIRTIDIRFRSGYAYKELWHKGIRNATIPALIRETGKNITLGKIRFDSLRDFQCIKRGLFLGREGRIDAFPFFNDTPVWRQEHQVNDTHWPVVPHDSLWLREAVMKANGLPSVGKYMGPGVKHFESIPVPPRRVGILQRSPRSRRRLSTEGHKFFQEALTSLCRKYNMELVKVRTSPQMTLGQQVQHVNGLGMAVGLHGANMVNTMFMPAGAAVFEIFPWRYVRYYYAGGANSGLRYSFHEPESGIDRNCSFETKTCFMHYRESVVLLSKKDQKIIHARLERSMRYLDRLHRRYPDGHIPLKRVGNFYHFKR